MTFLTRPEDDETLERFYREIRPGGNGWKKVVKSASERGVELGAAEQRSRIAGGLVASLFGMLFVYSAMFSTGYWLYGRYATASVMTVLALVFAYSLWRTWTALSKRE